MTGAGAGCCHHMRSSAMWSRGQCFQPSRITVYRPPGAIPLEKNNVPAQLFLSNEVTLPCDEATFGASGAASLLRVSVGLPAHD